MAMMLQIDNRFHFNYGISGVSKDKLLLTTLDFSTHYISSTMAVLKVLNEHIVTPTELDIRVYMSD